MKYITIALIALLLVGCGGSGFNRGNLGNQIGVKQLEYTDDAIERALKKKANLPKPFTLAVYFHEPDSSWSNSWYWSGADRSQFIEALVPLKKEIGVSKVIQISGRTFPTKNEQEVRLVAARFGADAVLEVRGYREQRTYNNNWSATYALLAPMFFVPGSESETIFVSNAIMWDVRNGFLYLAAESEVNEKATYVPVFKEAKFVTFQRVKEKGMKELQAEIAKMLRGQ